MCVCFWPIHNTRLNLQSVDDNSLPSSQALCGGGGGGP
jgi:hypothetical protein